MGRSIRILQRRAPQPPPQNPPEEALGPDGLPIPPTELVELVAGTPDVAWFLEGGRRGAESITELLNGVGIRIEELSTILDFGCGCGRVIRHFRTLSNAQLYGV